MFANCQQTNTSIRFIARSFSLTQCYHKKPNLNSKNYYDILGVESAASDKTIRKAFLKLSKEYHPDSDTTDKSLHEKFVKINEAFTVLSKKSTRADYDLSMNMKANPTTTTKSQPSRPSPSPFEWKQKTNFRPKQTFREEDVDWRQQFDLLRRQLEKDRQRMKNARPSAEQVVSSYLTRMMICSFIIGFIILIYVAQWRTFQATHSNYVPRSRSYQAYREWQQLKSKADENEK